MTEWLLTLTPLFALAVNVIVQIVSAHLTCRVGLSIFVGLICGFATNIMLLCIALTANESFLMIDSFVSLITYFSLSFCYWATINLNITSLRIRMLREILAKQDIGIDTSSLLEMYSPQELINRRILRLEKMGQITNQGGRWVLQSKKLLILVFVSSLLRKLVMPLSI